LSGDAGDLRSEPSHRSHLVRPDCRAAGSTIDSGPNEGRRRVIGDRNSKIVDVLSKELVWIAQVFKEIALADARRP